MRKYTFVRQLESTDCGVAALSMICLYYGKETTITKLREVCGTGIQGTSIEGLCTGATKLGFDNKPIRISNEEFLKGEYTMPAICHTLVGGGFPHYVVLTKISKGKVTILDPASGKRKLTSDEFFKEFDNIMILLKPNTDFVATMIDSKSSISRMVSLLWVHKKLFIIAIILGLILTLIGIVSSYFSKILIDDILPNYLSDQLSIVCIIFLLIGLLNVALSAVRQHVVLYLSQKIGIPIMLGYYGHIFHLPMKFFGSRKTGDIITRFQDAGTIVSVASGIIMTVVVDIVFAIITGVVLYTINVNLFLLTLVFTVVSIILVYIFKQPYKKINRETMIASAALNSATIDSLRGIAAVKSNAAEDTTMEKIEDKYIDSLRIAFRANVLSNYQGIISGVISICSSIFMMWMGSSYVISGAMTLGTLMAFSTLSGYFSGPVNRLVSLQFQFQEADIALKRLNELFDVEEEKELFRGTAVPESLNGDMVVKDLNFKYGTGRPVLTNVNMVIPKGSKVAIIGESGCGKSTLCNMLSGLWSADSGDISVNGYLLSEMDIFEYRRRIAYIQQNADIFTGSIKDNIRVSKPSATDDEIRDACNAAGCSEFIGRMPFGYDTILEEAGANLSGGEKQRISLARALVKRPEILVMDEATSGLDFVSEKAIYENIFRNDDRTTIIVAHRLSTIQRCDRIFVLNRGVIEAAGTHDELITTNMTYRTMWENQVGSSSLPEMKITDEDCDIFY